MPWVRIDDGFARHPKVAAAGPLAMAMQIAGLCYCNRELTDGFIPRSVAATLIHWETEDPSDGGFNAVGIITDRGVMDGAPALAFPVNWTSVVETLLKYGLWEEAPGGFRIHDYLDYQPPRDSVLLERNTLSVIRSDAGKKGAAARWNGKTYGKQDGNDIASPSQTHGPVPVPVPVPVSPKETPVPISSSRLSETEKMEGFDEWWSQYPRKENKKKAADIWRTLSAEDRAAAIDRLPIFLPRYLSDDPQFTPLPTTWLNGRRWEDQPLPPKTLRVTNGRVDFAAKAKERTRQEESVIEGSWR